MAKKGRNVARKTMSRSDDLLEAAGFLAAPEAQKKRIEDALANAITTDPIPRPEILFNRPKKLIKPKRRPKEMENGGLTGGQKKLDKNKDGKISGEDFKILRGEKKNTKVQKMMGGGQVCRGGGAAMSGTKFSGVR